MEEHNDIDLSSIVSEENISKPQHLELTEEKTPFNLNESFSSNSGISKLNLSVNSSDSSTFTPRDLDASHLGIEDYSSSSSTPRDELSSGSPSPTPDDINGDVQKPKIKLGKAVGLMMQALNSLQSPEEKIAALCKKYADLLQHHKLSQKQLRACHRKIEASEKENEEITTEKNQILLARGKLESLCRELQKQNKAIRDERVKKNSEELEIREKMKAQFEKAIKRVDEDLKGYTDDRNRLHAENRQMRTKLNEVLKKFTTGQSVLENKIKSDEQLYLQTVEKMQEAMKQEKIAHAEEKIALMKEVFTKEDAFQNENLAMTKQLLEKNKEIEKRLQNENKMMAQLKFYTQKFEVFQSTMEKSNETFTQYRTDMEKMGMHLQKFEKESAVYQKKLAETTKSLNNSLEYSSVLEIKQAKLEKLSRALQVERNDLAQRLRKYEADKIPQRNPKKKQSRKISVNSNTIGEKDCHTNNKTKKCLKTSTTVKEQSDVVLQSADKENSDPKENDSELTNDELVIIDNKVEEEFDCEASTSNEDADIEICTEMSGEHSVEETIKKSD